MADGIKVWLDSGANIHSCNRQELTWEELGITEEEWDAKSEDEQEEIAKDIAFSYSDWGFEKH